MNTVALAAFPAVLLAGYVVAVYRTVRNLSQSEDQ